MIEKIKGITIQGRCFADLTPMEFFSNSPDNKVTLVYGKNGSGKSTVTAGFHNLISDRPTEDLWVKLLGPEKNNFSPAEIREHIFVFNEEYIDQNIKIDDNGLGTIVLLGDEVNLQAEIDAHILRRKAFQEEKEKVEIDLEDFRNERDPVSPAFHLNKIREQLRKGGWSERDRSIKGNKTNTPVTEKTLFDICKRKSKDTLANLSKAFNEKKALLDRITSSGKPYELLQQETISMDANLEQRVCTLLATELQRPVLSPREQMILQTIQDGGQGSILSSMETFSRASVDMCPYCYQPMAQEYKEALLADIHRVINRDVEEHIAALEALTFPTFEEDYGSYEDLNFDLIRQIRGKIAKCQTSIREYEAHIAEKKSNAYTPIFCSPGSLSTELGELNTLLETLQVEILAFNHAISTKKALEAELLHINYDIAHHEVATLYRDYEKQIGAMEKTSGLVEKAKTAIEGEDRELQRLRSKQSDRGRAVKEINHALAYVFFAKNRLSLELNGDKYYLKSNGKDVLPKNVSIGERNILALCYFFTQIMSNQPAAHAFEKDVLVVIDDPVSSFDFENRIGILSYINSQICRILTGNPQSRILIFTHDLTTMHDLEKVVGDFIKELYGIKKGLLSKELKNRRLTLLMETEDDKDKNIYSRMMKQIYAYAAEECTEDNLAIGNIMRRVLEAYASFNYKAGIQYVTRNKLVLESLGDLADYFGNALYRLVLHSESHMEDQVAHAHNDIRFYDFISENEKRKTARDILCLLYLLNPHNVMTNLKPSYSTRDPAREIDERDRRIAQIQMWIDAIREETKEVEEEQPTYIIHLFDFALSAGSGNPFGDDSVPYEEYATHNAACDCALRISGDSMEPEIPNGSIVLIQQCQTLAPGDIGAFFYNGQDYCKRLMEKDGKQYLESLNPRYAPIEINPELEIYVHGKVVDVDKGTNK